MTDFRVAALVLLLVLLASCGGDEEPTEGAMNPAEQVQAGVDQINQEQPQTSAPGTERQPVPEMEQRCSDVSDQQIEEHAREYQRSMSGGEMLVISPSNQKVHDCWRYQLWLDGEISDYGSGSSVM